MENKNCLNCNELIQGKFCLNCGQKTDTHRITFKHFIAHDLVHGVWHFDKGLLFTLKQIITRPGYAALDYISGKRIQFYNIFYFLLIVIGLNLLVFHYSHNTPETNFMKVEGDGVSLVNFFSKNIKLILVSLIPFLAFNSWILFKKLKFNYIEHIIIAGFAILGSHLVFLVFNLFNWATQNSESIAWNIIMILFVALIIVFPGIVYVQVAKGIYKTFQKVWRISVLYLLFIIEIIIALLVLVMLLGTRHGFEGTIQFL